MKIELSDAQVLTAINALNAAAEQYGKDAKVHEGAGLLRTAKQFYDQQSAAEALANYLETQS